MVTWVLESNVFAEVCFDEMVAHLKARGQTHHIVRVIPFVHEIDGKVPEITGPCVVYGSIGVQKLAARHGWTPGVFTGDGFSEREAVAALGDMMVNSKIYITKFSEAFELIWRESLDDFFIKPNTDTKEFAGTVMGFEDFGKWRDGMLSSGYLDENADFEVVISRPKKLGCEWRVVVVDGKIAAASIYRQYGIVKPERHIIPEVEKVVYEAHRLFQPAPVYVIDVAQVGDDYKIVEYNTFNSAGLYACDVPTVLDAVSEYVERSA